MSTPNGIVFARCVRRVPEGDFGDGMLFNSINGVSWDLKPGVGRDIVNRVPLDVRAAVPEARAPPLTTGGAVAKKSLHQAISGIGEVTGTRTSVSGANMRDWE